MCDLRGEEVAFMRCYFEAKYDNLVQEGAHFVKEVVHGSKEGVPLTCLKGVVRIYGEVTTRKLLLKG